MNKQPLILLPGTLCNHRLWSHQEKNLSDIADVNVADLTKENSIKGLANSVLQSAPNRFALAGLSLGGIVSLEIMRQAPERVTNLALLDSNPLPPTEEQIETWKYFIQLANDGHFFQVTKKYLLPTLIRQESQENENMVSTIIKMAEEVGKESMIRQMTALINRPDSRKALPKINCPTLVMLGRQDQTCTLDMHKMLNENIADADLTIIEECGHLSSIEQPQAVTAVLRYWLQRRNQQ